MNEPEPTAFKSAFKRDLGLAASQPLQGLEFGPLYRRANAAWGVDPTGFVAAARSIRASYRPKPKLALRMASAFWNIGDAEAAYDVLASVPPPADGNLLWFLLLARAALATARDQEAQAALSQARLAASTEKEREEVADLAALAACALLRMESWQAGAHWAQRCLDAGQPRLAEAALCGCLARLDPKTAHEQAESIITIARNVLRVGDAQAATRVLVLMGDLYGSGKSAEGRMRSLLRSLTAQACAAAGLWRDAIRRFDIGSEATGILAHDLCELARCVGADLLAHRPFVLAEPRPRRVFDIFPFNGEFQMLELKLAEMGPWVEKFVLVEAAETFSGKPKPLFFEANRHRFKEHAEKILHVRIDHFPDHLTSPWAREFFQRDSAAGALSGLCAASDVVIISDVDEIIREESTRAVAEPLVGADLRQFNFFLNYEMIEGRSPVRTVFARADLLSRLGPSYLRLGLIGYRSTAFVPDAGWHFSSVGSAAEVGRKFASFSHTELSHLDEAAVAKRLAHVRANGSEGVHVVRQLDSSFPEFIARNRERLSDLLL